MDNPGIQEEQPQEETQSNSAFTLLCVLLVGAALGFMMYRVAHQPREIAGDLPEHRVAPAGTYFAREYVAMTTERGVIGLPPGTAVFVRQKGPETWVVNDGIDDITLKPASLTMDVDLASNLRAHDAEAQSRAAASQARAEAMYQAYLMKKRITEGMEMDAARRRVANIPIGTATSLDKPPEPQPGGVIPSYGGYGYATTGPSYYNYQTQQWIGAR